MSHTVSRLPSPASIAPSPVATLATARTDAPADAKACAHHWLLQPTTRRGR